MEGVTSLEAYTRSRYRVNDSPEFCLLSEGQRADIFYAALEILERTGARIYDEEVRDILSGAGCWLDGDRVRIPMGLSQWAVRTAPSRIALYDQKGNRKLLLGGNNTYYGPGPSNTYHRDPHTGERRRPVLEDKGIVARVCDALPNIDFVQDLGTPVGMTDTLADVYTFGELVKNTNKPIVHWGFDIDQYQDILDIAVCVAGSMEELQKRPFLALYSEPSSPLLHAQEAIGKAVFAGRHKVPVVYTPCVMAGATTPATLAGTIAMGIAESLVGIVVSQLVREGTPIIMGGVYAIMDMKTTVFSYGSPEFHTMQAGIAEVAGYMDIPVFGTAGCTDSHILDGQAGGEAAMSILMAALSGANLVHDLGYTGSGSTGSLEQLVMDDEIVGMVKRFMQGIKVEDETLALDVVDKVGPGGHFLGEKHTLDNFKKETWFPTLINRMRHDGWQKMAGGTSMGDRVREKLQQIIQDHKPEPLSDEKGQKIEEILARAEKREARKAKEKK